MYLIFGGLVLSYGANQFVKAASSLAMTFKISPVIIGLTIVAFGTSAPEMAVNILAAYEGSTELAMGNVVGSNIFNVSFILGICAIIAPLYVSNQLIRIDIPIMSIASILLWFMVSDLTLSLMEGLILLAGIVGYTLLQLRLAVKEKKANEGFEEEYVNGVNPWKNSFFLLLGIILLVGGAKLFVEGAILGARWLGISEAIIGLTIIAAGTSLPEVATSVAATLKGERDIAVGNVIGSNIFNILGVLGASSLVSFKDIPVSSEMAKIDISVMLFISLLCLPFVIWKKQLNRPQGIIFFLIWLSYTTFLILKS
jgi:cation:H+ antiporter